MTAATTLVCLLNGELVSSDAPCIRPDDRSFRFGDGVFETIALAGGVPYQWELHRQRLLHGAKALGIAIYAQELERDVRRLLAHTGQKEGFVRIQVSRGSGSAGYRPEASAPPLRIITLLPCREAPAAPARLWHSRWRKIPAECLPQGSKLSQGINATLALMDAAQNGGDEALQCDLQGHLSEAASGNLFWVEEGELYTPALSSGCLAGTTRSAFMRLNKGAVQEALCLPEQLERAQAVAICNVGWGIWPVAALDPQGYRWDAGHPLWQELIVQLANDRAAYAAAHAQEWR